ncbi:MAG TPA: VWA domain-containing protein [Chthonomonadaceae bacterium]|nr:VWA domain-containing protein [Chthonomonadaceae bacterium]
MYLLSPLALLWAVPIGGIIVVMYILKLRRKDVIVSSTFLWRQVIRDVQANAPFQKLRRNLLLLLQLIAAAAIIFALAGPGCRRTTTGGRNIVLIIDTSASMGATDVSPSRLDEAKRKAHEVVRSRRPRDLTMIIAASSRPRAVTGFTDDGAELDRAIDGLMVRDTQTNMRDALQLAADLVGSRNEGENGVIELISDGGFESQASGSADGSVQYTLASVSLNKAHVNFHPVGKRQNNVGIVGVDFRRNLGSERTVELLVIARNFSHEAKRFNEEVYAEDNLVEAREVSLPPNGEDTEPIDLPEPDRAVKMRIKLDAVDDLAGDNTAALILKPRKTLKALLVGPENLFLENALRVDPSVSLSKTAQFTSGKGYDVVIFNDAAPAKLPEGNYLFLHCTSDQAPVKVSGTVENVQPADWERDHPVMRYVDFGSERFGAALKAVPTGWGRELCVAESGSLIVAGEKDKMRAVFVGFSLNESMFPLRVPFPIFISNCVRWLGTGSDDSEIGGYHTGEVVTIPAPPGADRITVTKPDGTKRDVKVGPQGGASFDDTDEAGIYQAAGGGYSYAFAANLASASESDTTPHDKLTISDSPATAEGHRVPDPVEWLPYLIIAALAVLAYEWWAFHRRVYVN